MQTVNLKKYYYPLFVKDTFVEVPDEVAEALLLMHREENNRTHKIWYHKAYYSLDCEDGIENCALDFTTKSPEDILVEQEEEQLFLTMLPVPGRGTEGRENPHDRHASSGSCSCHHGHGHTGDECGCQCHCQETGHECRCRHEKEKH